MQESKLEVKVYDYTNQIKNRHRDLEEAKFLSEKEKQRIREYIAYIQASNMSLGRIVKTLHSLMALSKHFGMKLDRIDVKNIQSAIAQLNQSDYAEWSKQDLRAITKRYVRYSLGKKFLPHEWDWLKVKMRKEKMKMPGEGEILTVDDVEKILSVCRDIRDKALISALYESACRPSEILTLKIRDVKFDKYGCIVYLRQSKTSQRPVRLVNSTPFLSAWLNVHPRKKETEYPLWIVTAYKIKGMDPHIDVFTLSALRKLLERLKEKAGIKKRVYPYIFRHSRITHLLMNPKYPQSVVKRMVGWTDDSEQISTYLHMTNDAVDKLVLEANGLVKEEDSEDLELTKPLLCPRCDMQNPPESKVCQRCWFALDSVFQTEIDQAITQIAGAVGSAEFPKVMKMSKEELIEWKRKKQIEKLVKKRNKIKNKTISS